MLGLVLTLLMIGTRDPNLICTDVKRRSIQVNLMRYEWIYRIPVPI